MGNFLSRRNTEYTRINEYLEEALTSEGVTRPLASVAPEEGEVFANQAPVPLPEIISTIPLSEIITEDEIDSVAQSILDAISTERLCDLLYSEKLGELRQAIVAYGAAQSAIGSKLKVENSADLEQIMTAIEEELKTAVTSPANYGSIASSSTSSVNNFSHLIPLPMRNIFTLIVDEHKLNQLLSNNEGQSDLMNFLRLILGLEVEKDAKQRVLRQLINISQLNPLIPLNVSTQIALHLKEQETGVPFHMTYPTSREGRLEGVLQDAYQLLGLLSAGIVGTIAALLFYPAVVQGWKPFFEMLNWPLKTIDKFLNVITGFATIGNSAWNTSLLNDARKIWFTYTIKPFFAMLYHFFQFKFTSPQVKENFFKFLYTGILLIGVVAYAIGMNRLVKLEDYADYDNPLTVMRFTKIMNQILMTAATHATVEYSRKLRKYWKREKFIATLIDKGDEASLKAAFSLRMLLFTQSVWSNLTPMRLKFSLSPISMQIFDSIPLQHATRILRDRDSDRYYASQLEKWKKEIKTFDQITEVKTAPSDAFFDSFAFKMILFGLSFFAIAGIGILGVLPSAEMNTQEIVLQGILGSIGFIGLIFNELNYSFAFMDNIRGPSAARYIGGYINFICNLVIISFILICLPSGPGPGKGWFLLLEPAFPSEWNGLSTFLSSVVWAAFIIGGITNAFPIINVVNQSFTYVLNIFAHLTNNVSLMRKITEFKRIANEFEKTETYIEHYQAAAEQQRRQNGNSEEGAPLPELITAMNEALERSPKLQKFNELSQEEKKQALRSNKAFAHAIRPEAYSAMIPA